MSICANCHHDDGPHFVPPFMGERGFFACDAVCHVCNPGARPISGGAIAPLALMLLPLLPQLIDSALAIYDSIANHPTTPAATATQIKGYVSRIRVISAAILAAPLPGDEPSPA